MARRARGALCSLCWVPSKDILQSPSSCCDCLAFSLFLTNNFSQSATFFFLTKNVFAVLYFSVNHVVGMTKLAPAAVWDMPEFYFGLVPLTGSMLVLLEQWESVWDLRLQLL